MTHSARLVLTRLIGGRGSFRSDAAISMSAGVAARAITLASIPLIARYYAPADLGLLTIVLSLTQYFSPLATLRYDIAVVIAPTARMSRSLTLGLLVWIGFVALLVGALIVVVPASGWTTVSGLKSTEQGLLFLAPILLALLGSQMALQSYLTKRRMFLTLGVAQVLQAVTTPAMTLGLLWFEPASGWSATQGALCGFAVSVGAMAASAGAELAPWRNRGWPRIAAETARRYKIYPLYMLPYSLSGGLSERILQVSLVSFYSLSVLGAFSLARQIVNAPAVLLASSLRQVMLGHSATQVDPEARRSRVITVLRFMIDIVAPATGFALVWLPSVLLLATPADWSAMASYAWWCLFPAGALFLCSWLDRMLDVLGRARLGVAMQVCIDASVVAIVVTGGRIGLDSHSLIAAIMIAQTTYYLTWLAVLLRLLDVSWRYILSLATRLTAKIVLTGACHWVVMRNFPFKIGFSISIALLVGILAATMVRFMRRQTGR